MDSSTKTTKPSSNISEIVQRFAKICRLGSIGVFSGENPNSMPSVRDSSDATSDEADCKIHPQLSDEMLVGAHHEVNLNASETIPKLFDAVSSLTSSYILFQEAHIPYNPEKLQSADYLIVSKFNLLSQIKHSYKEKQGAAQHVSDFSSKLSLESQKYLNLVEKLELEMKSKDAEILRLKQEIEELDRMNAELEAKLEQNAKPSAPLSKDVTSALFSDAFQSASRSIHDFAKPLIAMMKASGWDLDLVANAIEDAVAYTKRADKKYAIEAYICRRMFNGNPLTGNVHAILRFQDPFDALIEDPDCGFAEFCRSKYLLVVDPVMERSFFGNSDQQAFVAIGGHPRTPFYRAFVKMAKCIWVLRVMAGRINPTAQMFWVWRGTAFSEEFMESVTGNVMKEVDGIKVGFMVMPGFKIGGSVIKCKVYVSDANSAQGAQ